MITEDQLEQLCLGWFRDQGYDAVYGPDIAPEGDHSERSDYRQVILQGRLLLSRKSIPAFQRRNLKTSWQTVAKPEHPVLIKSNRALHNYLLEGVPVTW